MKIHELKKWPEFFDAVWRQEKLFEVRKDDRNFQVGEYLMLQRFDPETGDFTGDELMTKITYKLSGGQFGIEPGYCVLGIEPPMTVL